MCSVWKKQCLSISYPRKLCSAPSRAPFLCTRPVCRQYLVPLGGLHSVKVKGLVVPPLDVAHKTQKLDMRKFLSEKVHCAHQFSVNKSHSEVNKAPPLWVPSLSYAEQFGSSSMSSHLICGKAKVILNPWLGLCPYGMTGWHGISAQLVVCALLEPSIQSWEGGGCSFHLPYFTPVLLRWDFPIPSPKTMQNWTGTKYAVFKASTLGRN